MPEQYKRPPFPLRCKDADCGEVVMVAHKRPVNFVQAVGESRIVGLRDGDILAECGTCLAVSVWEDKKKPKTDRAAEARSGRLQVLRGPTFPSTDNVVSLMQERRAEFSKEKLRERGRAAVGLRFDVFMRDAFRCRYCGISVDDGAILHADHVIPESKGGPTTLANLVTACIDCNLGKSNKDLPESRSVVG